jgi:geranylgeranyl diphosphate synthase, type II
MAEAAARPATDLLAEARDLTDRILERWAGRLREEVPGRDGEALAYALATPGKRVRPALLLASYRAVGGRSVAVAEVAAAVETVHTYSLVHDDLPCMDDDDLRRGRPTTHVAFDVPTATRAGYLLVPVAARVLAAAAEALALPPAALGRMAVELFRSGGIQGMVGGQWLDLEAEGRTLALDDLIAVHRGKTGALIRASCTLGAIAGEAGPDEVAALTDYGEDIGLAFQIADDVLDVTASREQLGKTPGKDAAARKATYPALYGVEGSRARARAVLAEALDAVERFGDAAEWLRKIACFAVERQK